MLRLEAEEESELPGLRVFGTADAFHAARVSADVLLSPIQDTRSTAAPPLVWLECLAMGIPILTTEIPGTDEVVIDGKSGYTVRSPEAGRDRLQAMMVDREVRRRLREGARRVAVERYTVDRALNEYLNLWTTLANGSGVQSGASGGP